MLPIHAGGGIDEYNQNIACPMHVDNTRYCQADSLGGLALSI